MSDITLAAELRTATGSGPVGRLRAASRVPGVLYGKGAAPVSVSVDHRELRNTFNDRANREKTFTLVLEGKSHTVKIQDIQRDPVRNTALHVDFLLV